MQVHATAILKSFLKETLHTKSVISTSSRTIGFYLLPIFTVRPQKIYWTELTLIQLHTIKISNMFENLSCMTNENLNNIKKNKN